MDTQPPDETNRLVGIPLFSEADAEIMRQGYELISHNVFVPEIGDVYLIGNDLDNEFAFEESEFYAGEDAYSIQDGKLIKVPLDTLIGKKGFTGVDIAIHSPNNTPFSISLLIPEYGISLKSPIDNLWDGYETKGKEFYYGNTNYNWLHDDDQEGLYLILPKDPDLFSKLQVSFGSLPKK